MTSIRVMFFLVGLSFFHSVGRAQNVTTEAKVIRETFGHSVIPNVDDPLSLASLLSNDSVRKELGLREEREQFVVDFLARNRGSFGSVVGVFNGRPGPKEIQELRERNAAHREQSKEILDELMSPTEWKRLRQIAYQVEVWRMGLGESLANGQLGVDAGILEQQRDVIQRKAAKIQSDVDAQIMKILIEAQSELLNELPVEQRNKAKSLLGTPFIFRESQPQIGRQSQAK